MRRAAQDLAYRAILLGGLSLMTIAATPIQPATALTGEWGGFQIVLKLDNAGGSLQFDCAAATIDAPVRPDTDGNFSAPGRFEAFPPGPDRRGDTAPVLTPAQFSGRIDGKTLQLTMRLDNQPTPQEFSLVRDRKVKIIRCL